MKLQRLSGRKVCERVKTKGMLWKGKHFNVRFLHGLPRNLPPDSPCGLYVGVLTSAKLDKSAVKRNRMRRRCREALRLTLLKIDQKLLTFHFPLSTSFQLLLMPRSSNLSAPFDEILADAETFLSSLRA